MRLVGKLTSWNDEKGFGFITPSNSPQQLFVHISAFPRDEQRPSINEFLSYEAEVGKNGKPQAVRVQRLANSSSRKRTTKGKSVNVTSILLVAVVVVTVGFAARSYFSRYSHRLDLEQGKIDQALIPAGCDGRTMCSQMTSCSEAKWFINNCPLTKMDGDHDGVPCESQWCSN